jgi:uncharacterized membrane protein YkoI
MHLARALGIVALLAAVLVPAPDQAVARDRDPTRLDQVRRAVESGEIRPLGDILKAVRAKLPGEVAGVEVEKKEGRWLYEFRVVDTQGRLFEVHVDARSGEIERIKEK